MAGQHGQSAPAVLTLRDLVLAVQAYADNDAESVAAIVGVLASGRIRLRPAEQIAGRGRDRCRTPLPELRPVRS